MQFITCSYRAQLKLRISFQSVKIPILIIQVSLTKLDSELSYMYLVGIIPPDKKSNVKTLEWHDISKVFHIQLS